MVHVKRALLSCYDKTGLENFAKVLASLGVELVASGGTAERLTKSGLRVTSVEEFAGIKEQLDGRVKTLHPKIHAGILAKRDDPAHVKSIGEGALIDLVVVNLYPFEQTVQKPGVSLAEAIEQIDIGGVALLRAAAKNFSHVGVICQPAQYRVVAEALTEHQGRLPEALAQELALTAFRMTSGYDTAISGYLSSEVAAADTVTMTLRKQQELRYGENPHQHGVWYVPAPAWVGPGPAVAPPWGLGTLQQRQGKELSYNNLLDIDAAFRALLDFEEPTCAIVKHNSLCGLASAAAIEPAYERAFTCDSESAFGGIVGVNRPVDSALAKQLAATFLEVVIAPSVQRDALAILGKKANLRMVTVEWPKQLPSEHEWRQLSGSWVLQVPDRLVLKPDGLKTATKRQPTEQERADLLFAWKSVKHVKSNGIVLAKDQATVGIGQGQPSRVGSVRLAITKAAARGKDTVAASDGFFPFADNVEELAKAGVTAIIQPGGSIRDAEVIDAANRHHLAMLFTGIRHFRH